MDVKEWFRQLPQIEARIRAKRAQVRKYRELAARATSSTEATRISGSSNRSRVEDAVVNICDLEAAALEEGMVSLKEAGMRKVRDGVTSLEAAFEVTGGE